MRFTDKLRWVPGALMLFGFLAVIAGICFMYVTEGVSIAIGFASAAMLFPLALVSKAAIRYLDRTQDDAQNTNNT